MHVVSHYQCHTTDKTTTNQQIHFNKLSVPFKLLDLFYLFVTF